MIDVIFLLGCVLSVLDCFLVGWESILHLFFRMIIELSVCVCVCDDTYRDSFYLCMQFFSVCVGANCICMLYMFVRVFWCVLFGNPIYCMVLLVSDDGVCGC